MIDIPKAPRAYLLDRDNEQFMRKMRMRFLMANKKSKHTHRFKLPSSWHPLSTPRVDVENYLESTRLELSKTQIRDVHDNLTKTERQALKSVRENKHLVFQKPEKSRGVVVINKYYYLHECETMLKGNQYTEICADMILDTVNLVKKQLYLI